MNTDDLIRRIAQAGTPVRRLPPPWRRALAWLAIGVPYIVAVIWVYPRTPELGAMHGTLFFLEQIAAGCTAVVAAWVAFCTTVPGCDCRLPRLVMIPLAIWLASIGGGCLSDWLQFGPHGVALRPDWKCLAPSLLLGWLPLTVMVLMLRRGAPLRPHASLALGALAAAALTNMGLRLFHLGDVTIMVLVWHLGGAMVLSVAAGLLGRQFLNWREARARA